MQSTEMCVCVRARFPSSGVTFCYSDRNRSRLGTGIVIMDLVSCGSDDNQYLSVQSTLMYTASFTPTVLYPAFRVKVVYHHGNVLCVQTI